MMRLLPVIALLSATALADPLSAPMDIHHRVHKARQQPHYGRRAAAMQDRQASPYLTSKTAPFAVNGSAIPEVNFDIGESYAGNLPIDETGKELWFWFTPTDNPAAADEILIWLNGGPGCSSLDGFFHENGPVVWQPGTYLPVLNSYTWRNLTNVVWIDQPVGTGFSLGTPNATNEIDVATQFLPFWKNFMDTFDLHGRKVYVTGESYAGMYAPYIASAMVDQNDTEYFNVHGLMVYDPSIGYSQITQQVPAVAFTDWNHQLFPFNDTFQAHLHNASAACGFDEFLSTGLTFPPAGPFGPAPGVNATSGRALPGCRPWSDAFSAIQEINPCFDIYQVSQICPLLWDVLGFPTSDFYLPPGFDQPYFSRTDVKLAIHAPVDVDWMICTDINVFVNGTDQSPPSGITGGPLANVIEHTNNVIVGHGLIDMILLANGSLLTIQNLTWNGAQGFSAPPIQPFYVPYHEDFNEGSMSGAGVMGSWHSERGLTFVTVDESGHMIPEFQASSSYRHLEKLLGRIGNLSEISPFTTQPWVKQPNVTVAELGLGTGWTYTGTGLVEQ